LFREAIVGDLDTPPVESKSDVFPRYGSGRRNDEVEIIQDLTRPFKTRQDVRRARRRPGYPTCSSIRQNRQQAAGCRRGVPHQSASGSFRDCGCDHLRLKGRPGKAPAAPHFVDHVTHVGLRHVHALPTRWAYQGVVVKRGCCRNAALARLPWKVEREIEQVVDVENVRPCHVKHVCQLRRDARRCVRVLEAIRFPVVDDLDDR
jgi:hypothetical protein